MISVEEAVQFLDGLRDAELSAADARTQQRAFLENILQQNAELKRQLDQARQLAATALQQAHTDPMTLVKNRAGFDQGVERTFRRAKRTNEPVAMLLVDVDRLKKINDLGGHRLGDEAITTVAGVLKQVATREGDVIGRLGGDEFAVLLAGCNLQAGLERAGHIRDLLAQSAFRGPDADPLSVSVGVATSEKHGYDRDGLYEAADAAMYAAKADRAIIPVEEPDSSETVDTDDGTDEPDFEEAGDDGDEATEAILHHMARADGDLFENPLFDESHVIDAHLLAEDQHAINDLVAGIMHASVPAVPVVGVLAAAAVMSESSAPAPRRRMRMA